MIGKAVGGYRIIEQIGMGGMATVYKAYDASMDRYVALKTLPQQYLDDPEFRARFEREAHAIARLEHAHILPVFAYGEQDGVIYLAMRYMQTGTLSDLIKQGPLALNDTARYLSQVASALDYAHSTDIIHRDVKPTNVLVDKQDNAYLTDFGIAKIVGSAANLTATGALVGTPQYMSPEQFESGEQVSSPASDQYSLAVMIYEMVTGRTPYQAETPWAIIGMHQRQEALPLPRLLRPDLPDAAENALLKALSRDPALRYPTCTALAEAFHAGLTRTPVHVSGPAEAESKTVVLAPDAPARPLPAASLPATQPTTQPASASAQRGWRSVLVAAALLLFVTAAVVVGVLVTRQDQPAATAPVAALATDARSVTQPPVPTATRSATALPSATLVPSPTAPGIQALRNGVPVRSGPGSTYSVLQQLNSGDQLEITGISEDGSWYQVRTSDGQLGWVAASSASVLAEGDLLGVPIALAPTDVPTATPTPTPTATVTLMPTETSSATPTATVTLMPTATSSATPTATVTLTPTATSSATPTATDTLTPTATLTATVMATLPNTPAVPETTTPAALTSASTEVSMAAALPAEVRQALLVPTQGESVAACAADTLCIEAQQGGVTILPTGLSTGAGISLGGWSHDGQRLVFSLFTSTAPNEHLYIVNRDGSDLRDIALPGQNIVSAAWSPDDRMIAAHANCGLILIRLMDDGSLPSITTLAAVQYTSTSSDCYINPQWSPDSSRLVVSWISMNQQYPLDYEVRAFDVSAGSSTTLYRAELPAQPTCIFFQQAFSPDGQWVAYINANCQVRLIRADGSSEVARVAQFPYWWTGSFTPQWDPPAQSTAETPIAALPPEVQPALTEPAAGDLLVPCPGSGACFSDSEDRVTALTLPSPLAAGRVSLGGWSPDGQQVVFSLSESGPNEALHIINRDGSGLRTLRATDYNIVDTVMSPDGRQVAAHANCSLALIDIPADSTAGSTLAGIRSLRQQRNSDCYSRPEWSPDSSRVVVSWVDTQFAYPLTYQVLVVQVSDGSATPVYEVRLTSEPDCTMQQAFSPDGQWVAYVDARCQAQLVPADGSSAEPLALAQFPYWWTGRFTPQWGG